MSTTTALLYSLQAIARALREPNDNGIPDIKAAFEKGGHAHAALQMSDVDYLHACAPATPPKPPMSPTPAMKRWLEAIKRGRVVRMGPSWVNAMHDRSGSVFPARCTYVMTCKLHAAGWIQATPDDQDGVFRVLLTAAGGRVIE